MTRLPVEFIRDIESWVEQQKRVRALNARENVFKSTLEIVCPDCRKKLLSLKKEKDAVHSTGS